MLIKHKDLILKHILIKNLEIIISPGNKILVIKILIKEHALSK